MAFIEHPQALLAMLIAPTTARPNGQNPESGGNADLWNLQTLTVPSLAFTAVVISP